MIAMKSYMGITSDGEQLVQDFLQRIPRKRDCVAAGNQVFIILLFILKKNVFIFFIFFYFHFILFIFHLFSFLFLFIFLFSLIIIKAGFNIPVHSFVSNSYSDLKCAYNNNCFIGLFPEINTMNVPENDYCGNVCGVSNNKLNIFSSFLLIFIKRFN